MFRWVVFWTLVQKGSRTVTKNNPLVGEKGPKAKRKRATEKAPERR